MPSTIRAETPEGIMNVKSDANQNLKVVQYDNDDNVVPAGTQTDPMYVKQGDNKPITSNPTVDTNQYASGDCIGAVQTLADAARFEGGGMVLTGLEATVDSNTLHPAFNIIIFKEDPENSTTTDNSAFVLSTDDIDKKIAVIEVSSDDYILVGTKYSASLGNLMKVLSAAADDTDLYYVIESKDTPTFAVNTDLHLLFNFMRD